MPLTRGGAGARAIVIGIDRYDLGQIPALTGATNDALTACKWLVDIGVELVNIRLHLSPSTPLTDQQLIFNGQRVEYSDATWKQVWASLNALHRHHGERLFVVVSGHGLVVPPLEPILLLQDYGVDGDWSSNIGLESFIRFFLSLDFREQFLICDACENFAAAPALRSTVSPRSPPDSSFVPRSDTGLLAIYSASPGQRAYENEGQGLMMSRLLTQMDPRTLRDLPDHDPAQVAIAYDWSSGERALRLSRLVQDVIGPAVSEFARATKGAPQNPRLVEYGSVAVGPILRWMSEHVTDVIVEVAPPEDSSAVDSVRVVTLSPTWSHHVSNAATALPVTLKLPRGVDVVAQARSRVADRPVTPPTVQAQIAMEPVRLTFQLADHLADDRLRGVDGASRTLLGFNVRTYGPRGEPRYDAGLIYGHPRANELVTEALGAGLNVVQHECGPDLVPSGLVVEGIAWSDGPDQEAGPSKWDPSLLEQGLRISREWAGLLSSQTGGLVTVAPPGTPPEAVMPNLFIVVPDPHLLVGFVGSSSPLMVRRVVDGEVVEDIPLLGSSMEIARYLPGDVYDVEMVLPWGRWRQRVALRAGEKTQLVLPRFIGRPPLRNRMLGLSAVSFLSPPSPAAVDVGIMIGLEQWSVAACPGLALGFDPAEGRIEPLSHLSHPAWDIFFTSGRLDGAPNTMLDILMGRLEGDAPDVETDLLRVAAGYALLRAGTSVTDVGTLRFTSPIDESLDAILLRQMLTGQGPEGSRRAASLLAEGRRPLLRWGYDLLLSEQTGQEELVEEATRQVEGSVWTALRPSGMT